MAEVKRYFDYDEEGKPILVLYRPLSPGKLGYAIRINDAWKFSEDHNPDFVACVTKATQEAYHYLGLAWLATTSGFVTRRMAEIATVIQEGIDDLLKMPPRPRREAKEEVGELTVVHGSQTNTFAVTKGGQLHG